ncbi:hypothetical protein LR066_03415 [candidate division WOR-3 bacterium]|nr:hypothetical protein [candidate division WOR-3 bacterium]
MKKIEFDILLTNAPGSFKDTCKVIRDSGAEVLAYALTPVDSCGLLQIVTDNDKKMREAFKKNSIHFMETDVLVIKDVYHAGDIYEVSEMLARENININFSYSGRDGIIVFEVDNVDRTIAVLEG